jgi:GMP synthase (glutamine-hydrolysing)
MAKSKSDLKILLLQIRDDRRVREEEYASFVRYSGLSPAQIEILNVFDTPHFSSKIVEGYDALFVGGASEASVLEPDKYSFVKSGEDLLLYCIGREIPVFASCYGFQLAVIALGGQIIRQEKDFEMGVIPIFLKKETQEDPIFRDVSDGFMAVSVHQEKAVELPEGCVTLAYTEECIHAFRVKDKPFWAFQFHPEVDRATLVERLTIYKEKYTDDDAHLDEILSRAVETPESNHLVTRFVDRILLG